MQGSYPHSEYTAILWVIHRALWTIVNILCIIYGGGMIGGVKN